jgi:hypothetical protein
MIVEGMDVLYLPEGTIVKCVNKQIGIILELKRNPSENNKMYLHEDRYGFWGNALETYTFEVISKKRKLFNQA